MSKETSKENNLDNTTTYTSSLSTQQLSNKNERADSLAVMKENVPLMRYFDAQEDNSSYVLGYN
jgi:hypothetical protein